MAKISTERLKLRSRARWQESKKYWQLNITVKGQKRKSFYSKKEDESDGRDDVAQQAIFYMNNLQKKSSKFIKDVFPNYIAYLEDNKAKTSVKQPKSFGKTWIIPLVGHIRVDHFKDSDFQAVIDSAAKKGLSKKTLNCIKNEFATFWKWCRKDTLCEYEPKDIDIPLNAPKIEKTILTPQEFLVLMTTDTTLFNGERVTEPLIHFFRYLVLTGLRPGEGLALNNLDFSDNFLKTNITKSINDDGDITPGKNASARRRFVNCKLAQRELQLQHEEHPVADNAPFFACNCQRYLRDRLEVYCISNGITPIPPYNLRHTFESFRQYYVEDSLLKASNNYIGHTKQMSSYIHSVDIVQLSIAAQLDAIFDSILAYARNENENCGASVVQE